ncbi:MAG: anti-sigma factor domain-containing protein [Gemmatimonadales bacterium]
MTAHDWFIEHRAAWVARALDAEEERSFRDHLKRCPDCRAAVAELEGELAWLPMGVAPVAPRPGFRREALERIVGRPPRRGWMVPLTLAASLLVALGTAIRMQRRIDALERVVDSTRIALAAAIDTMSVARGAARVMNASFAMEGKHCTMMILADEHTHRWNVMVHGLPAPKPGEKYQFWFITDDGMKQGLALEVVPGRMANFTTGMPAGNAKVMGAALSIEPMDNGGTTMKGPALAKIML